MSDLGAINRQLVRFLEWMQTAPLEDVERGLVKMALETIDPDHREDYLAIAILDLEIPIRIVSTAKRSPQSISLMKIPRMPQGHEANALRKKILATASPVVRRTLAKE